MLSPLRGLVALGLLAATLVGLGGASANASHTPDGQPTDRDFVTGEPGEQPDGNMRLITFFNASSGPSGENPTGTVVLGLEVGGAPDPTIARYNVTCLKVAGNRATIGGVLVSTTGRRSYRPTRSTTSRTVSAVRLTAPRSRQPCPRRRHLSRSPAGWTTPIRPSVAATSPCTTRSSCRRTRSSASAGAGGATASRASGSAWRSSSRLASASFSRSDSATCRSSARRRHLARPRWPSARTNTQTVSRPSKPPGCRSRRFSSSPSAPRRAGCRARARSRPGC